MNIQQNISLKNFNTFKVDVTARYVMTLNSAEELLDILNNPDFNSLPKFILGNGSNVLFTQNFNGVILKPAILGFRIVSETKENIFIQAGAGENWNAFVNFCIAHHYAGAENLSDIPGAVGSAASQNIGAYGMEVSEIIDRVETIDMHQKIKKIFNHDECQFGYRKSIFKQKNNFYFITHVIFKLNKKFQPNIHYKPLQELLKNEKNLTLEKISQVITCVRQSKLPDTNQLGNAGSFFSNPVISEKQFETLLKIYSDMPHWKIEIPSMNKFFSDGTNRPKYFGIKARRQGESNRSVHELHDCCERRRRSGISREASLHAASRQTQGEFGGWVSTAGSGSLPTQSRKTKDEGYIGVKIPAAWLIEKCGFKGKRFGNAGVHEHHALVLVNYGQASGAEIKTLSEKIQRAVFEKFQIQLEPEVIIV